MLLANNTGHICIQGETSRMCSSRWTEVTALTWIRTKSKHMYRLHVLGWSLYWIVLTLKDKLFFGVPDTVFMLFFPPYCSSQHQVPHMMWFRRNLSFSKAQLKSQFYICVSEKWMNLPESFFFLNPVKWCFFFFFTVNSDKTSGRSFFI